MRFPCSCRTWLLAIVLLFPVVSAAAEIAGCSESTLPSNDPRYPAAQLILTCLPQEGAPAPYNGVLVVYAHGYEFPQYPLKLPDLTLNGLSVPQLFLGLGFGFATTSYHKNGYAIEQGGNDIDALVDYFRANVAPTAAVLVIGASEGGLTATMLVERDPQKYAGGLALCGPMGGAQYQIRYTDDLRVVFDYFFPSIFDFGVVNVPPYAFSNWPSYQVAINAALANDPHATDQLLRVTGVARSAADPAQDRAAVISLLAYNIGGMPDLIATAGGNPYGNLFRWYWGSDNDFLLNRKVERVQSDPTAVRYVTQYYLPNAKLQRPLVTLHTTHDPIVPFSHEVLYLFRAYAQGTSSLVTMLPVQRYGHCTFTTQEVLGAFSLLVQRAGIPSSPALDAYRLQE